MPKKGGKKVVLLAAVLLLAGGGFVAYQKTRASSTHEPEAETKKPVIVEPAVVEVEPFILNLADPAGDRYFRLNMRLVLDQRAIAQRSAGSEVVQVRLRDKFLSLLAKKRASEMTSQEGKEKLRAELAATAEALYAEPPLYDPEVDPAPAKVLDVLFTEFLVQ